MRSIYIARRVISELIRDKRTLAMMFVAPVLIMFLMKLIFTQSATTSVTVATVGVDGNIRSALNDVKHVSVEKKSTNAAAKQALKNQKVDAIVHQTSDNHYTVTYANTDATKTTLVKAGFKAALAQVGVKQLKQTTVKLSQTVTQMATTIQKVAPQAAGNLTLPTQKKQATTKITNKYNYGDKDTGFFNKIVPILMGFFVLWFGFLI